MSEAANVVNELLQEPETPKEFLKRRELLQRYRFCVGGNGENSPVSFCFEVKAFTTARAIALAQEYYDTMVSLPVKDAGGHWPVFHFDPHTFTEEDITDVTTALR